MATAFQSGAFQADGFQIDAAAGKNQALAITLDDVTVALTQTAKHSQSLAATLADVTVAVSQTAKHPQSLAATLDGVAVAISQSVASSGKSQSLAITLDGVSSSVTQAVKHSQALAATLDDVTVLINQIGRPSSNEIQYLGGAPGKKKYREKGSYWDRLLSSPDVTPEAADIIEEKVVEVVSKTPTTESLKQARKSVAEMRQAMEDTGIAYKKAYKEIYLQLVAEMRQQEEDEAIAHIIASLL